MIRSTGGVGIVSRVDEWRSDSFVADARQTGWLGKRAVFNVPANDGETKMYFQVNVPRTKLARV